ncbi:hypothetical protein ONE63_008078 [Megalurothrips usitatus]|uniref:Uncharacterized protein n=1 Tax=Megalurothrips usitatus TaxID=439358 RepID=A0AAV7XWM2_9NEOP|nr:hypothetical protein ONE63_008078 [Megalurothrips usitatus]
MFNASTAAGNIQATEDLNASYSADNLPKTDADRMAFVNTCIDSLRTVLSDPRAASAEFLVSSEGAPFMSAACRVLLDIATVWHEDTKPRAVTDVCSPVLFGRTLRNVLAHGNDMLESVPRYQPHLELALLAGRLVASDTGPAVDLLCGALQRPCHAHVRDQLRGRLLRAVAAKCDLMSAARRGDVDAVREGLRQAPRLLEARDGAGRGLLHHAAASGSAELVRQLLEAGAPLGADRAGETPLHCAASKDVAGALLEHGERLGSASGPQANTDGVTVVSVQACDAADHLGRLPLHAAVASRRQGVMEYLLTVAKVDVDATDRSGCTALHLAVEHDDVGMVNALLEAGACSALDVDDAGGSPLHLAAAAAGPAVMSGLVGATVARTLSAFSELDPPQALEPGYVVGVLLAGRDGRSMTPLLRAAAHGNAASLRTLLDLSAPLTDATEDGQTALHLAARCGSAAVVDIIAELVAAAPDGQELARSLMAPDTSGYLPLHYAAEFGHLEVVKTLWSFPLGPWPVFDWISGSRTALHLAAMHGHDEVVAFLVEQYAAASRGLPEGPHPPMCLAALYGHAGVLATLSGCGGADVVDADGYTPLHLAAEYGEEPSIEVLLAHGARRDVVDGVNNRTPLHLAALNGQVGAVRLLLGVACDDGLQGLDSPTLTTAPPHAMRTSLLEAEDYWGRTPLLLAVEHGAVLQELLEAGADWRHVDDRGETVLHRTARGHHNNVSKVLKFAKRRAPEQLKENVNRANESGRTPLDGAATAANAETIRLLVENGADVQIAPRTTSTLHIAVMSCHQAKSYDHVRTLLDLSPGYANVVFRHTRDPEPFPPLLCAVILGLKDVATLIAERCVDLHKEENCESLLILAKMKGIEGVVAILEDRGVRCPFPFDGSFGALPARPVQPGRVARPESGDARVRDFAAQNLKEAIELQDMEELRFLLGRGGLPDTDLGGGMTALDLAFDVIPYSDEVMATIVEALTDEPGVCKPLLEARRLVPRGRNTLLELAVQRKCKRTVAALLRAGFPPEGTVGPCSLLTYALQWSRDIFHELLRYAARPPGQVLPDEVPDKNACGEILTAETFVGLPLVIHLASWGTTEQLKTLLDYGVSPNTRTSQTVQLFGRVCGDSPLLSAAKKGDVDKVKLLLARGADPLLPDQSGFTALQLAAVYGHPDVARVLVRHRPDLAADAMQGLPNAAQLAAVCADAEHKPGCREVLKVLCDVSDDDMPALIEAAKEEARAILTEYSAGFEDQYIATMKSLSL